MRPAGGTFGAAEIVADAPDGAMATRAAFDPVSARFMMVILTSADPARPPLALATRSAP